MLLDEKYVKFRITLNFYENKISKMQETYARNILNKLGMTESEIDVVFAWLKIGPATVIQLAKNTWLKRITTHAIIQRLLEKWVFLETKNKTKRLVYPNDMKSLHRLLDKRKQEVEDIEKQLDKASQFLTNMQAWSQWFPNVRFYKGKEWIQLMFEEIIRDKKDTYVISDHRYFYDVIDNQFLEKSLEIRKKYKLKTKMLFPTWFEYFCFSQWIYEQELSIKSLPDNFPLIWAVNIWWDKIGFHTEKSWFITTTIIEDHSIAKIMLFMFENVWQSAGEY